MPIIRTFISKVKPGRMQDAVTQLSTFKRAGLDSGASHFTAYNLLTGPHFPGIIMNMVFADIAAWGAGREKITQHQEWVPVRDAPDAPIEIVSAILSEAVYMAGSVNDILEQTQVRYTIGFKPHRGRRDTVLRRLSRLADTAQQCGALAVGVRSVIAGTEGPRLLITAFHTSFAEFQATRSGVLESDVWNALSRNQDEASTRMFSTITTKLTV